MDYGQEIMEIIKANLLGQGYTTQELRQYNLDRDHGMSDKNAMARLLGPRAASGDGKMAKKKTTPKLPKAGTPLREAHKEEKNRKQQAKRTQRAFNSDPVDELERRSLQER